MNRKTVSIYVDPAAYERLKELCHTLGMSVSAKMDEMIKMALEELTGEEYRDEAGMLEYEALKREHTRLFKEAEKLAKPLKKRGTFDKLVDLSVECGIDQENLSNIREVAAKMLRKWTGSRTDFHQFISLMEAVKRKREAEHQLDRMRLGAVLDAEVGIE